MFTLNHMSRIYYVAVLNNEITISCCVETEYCQINNTEAKDKIATDKNGKLSPDIYIYIYIYEVDLQLGKLKENCLLLKLYRKLRKMFLSPRRESNPQLSQ